MTDLVPRFVYGDIDLTDHPYMVAFGSDFGQPETVYDLLSSLLEDGDLMVARRRGNRAALRIPVYIEEADLLANPLAAAAVEMEADKFRSTLTVDPGDGIAPVTVFETFAGDFVYTHDDAAEGQGLRRYDLVVPARPYSRSEALTTIGSEFVSDSIAVADECESTAGWSVYGSGQTATITVDSTAGHFVSGTGAVKFVVEPYTWDTVTAPANGGIDARASIRKTGLSIDASGGGYFIFRLRPEPGWELQAYSKVYLTTSGGGREEVSIVSMTAEGNGYTRYATTVGDLSTITAFELEGTVARGVVRGETAPNPGWWFDALGFASGATANQAARTLEIGGTARGEGSFSISGLTGLGDVLLYTCPDRGDGFRPDLRRNQTAGASTTDTAAFNGSYVPANVAVFERETRTLRPGAYVMLAHVKAASTSFSLDVDAQTILAGSAIGDVYSTGGTLTVPDTTDYHLVRVGVIDLPPHKVDAAADAVVRFTCSGSATAQINELLVFPLEDAALTWLECGTGTPSATVASRVWIDGPSADLPYGQIVVGTDVNRADARYVLPKSKGRHTLYPGRNLAYLLTSTAGGSDLSTSYFKRWHTWASEDG